MERLNIVRIASLGSGSSGNALLIEYQDTRVLVDCGFSLKETERRLELLGTGAENIDAVLVTHEHGDHTRGVGALARKYGLQVFLTQGTSRRSNFGKISSLHFINTHQPFMIGTMGIQPVAVPHDAGEPCQFVFEYGAKKLGLLTDLGSITPFVKRHYSGLNALLVECNHDLAMLEQGPYPKTVQRRISSDYGHLSNEQTSALLKSIDTSSLECLVLMHLSRQNNCSQLALDTIVAATGCDENWPVLADQDQGFDWLELFY